MNKRDKMMAEIDKTAASNGHSLRSWTKGRWGFNTHCSNCGAFVAITVSRNVQREGHRLLVKCGSDL